MAFHSKRACLLLVLLCISSALHAQPRLHSTKLQNKTILHQTTYIHPLQGIASLILNSSLYEAMLSSPDFIKMQDIAQRLWDNQTGAKRRVFYSRWLGK